MSGAVLSSGEAAAILFGLFFLLLFLRLIGERLPLPEITPPTCVPCP